MAAQMPNGGPVQAPAQPAGAQPAQPAQQVIYPPGEPLQEHVYHSLIGILNITTGWPDQAQRRQQLWVMAGNIVSLARMSFGPDAEPRHVSIRCLPGIRCMQVVLHRGGMHGDQLLVDARIAPNVHLFTGLIQEVNRVTEQAMVALRTRERLEEEALAEAIANEQF